MNNCYKILFLESYYKIMLLIKERKVVSDDMYNNYLNLMDLYKIECDNNAGIDTDSYDYKKYFCQSSKV